MRNSDKIRRLYGLTKPQGAIGYQGSELVALEKRLGVRLPWELKDYYTRFGKDTKINHSHNRLLNPNVEIGFSNDRYLMFYEENQAVVSWGIKEGDLALDNPPVWGNYGTNELPDWHLEARTTEDFFLLMAIQNGVFGGLKYHANSFGLIPGSVVDRVRKNWKEIACVSTTEQRIHSNDFEEVLCLCFDRARGCIAIFIGTSCQGRFDNLLDTLGVSWTYTSYEDDDIE